MTSNIDNINDSRILRIEKDLGALNDISRKQSETIYGVSIGMERINGTITKIIEIQDCHTEKLNEIEPMSLIARHWKFITFTVVTIMIVSLCIHVSLKELIGWIT